MLKVANSLYIATEWIKVLKMFQFWLFSGKKLSFSKKNWFFQKPLKIKIIVVGCNWITKISQNVEKVASSWKKKIGFSEKNFEFFCKPLKAAILMQNATELVSFV